VADEVVERRPGGRVQRHRQSQRGARRRHARQFAQGAIVVGHVFQDVERAHQVETGIGAGQRPDHAVQGIGALRAQLAQGRVAQVDEAGALQRQARAQARRHLQAARRGGGQFAQQRPGVEASGFDQPRLRPQRLVEAAVGAEQLGIAAERGGRVHAALVQQARPCRGEAVGVCGGVRVSRFSS
jgi:hypothetical protein